MSCKSTKATLVYPHSGPLERCCHGKIPPLCHNSILCFCPFQFQSSKLVIRLPPLTRSRPHTTRLLLLSSRTKASLELPLSVCVSQCESVVLFVLRLCFLSLHFWLSHSVATSLSLCFFSLSLPLRRLDSARLMLRQFHFSFVPVSQTVFVLWVEDWAAVVTPPTASHLTPPTPLSAVAVKGGINPNNSALWGNSSKSSNNHSQLAGKVSAMYEHVLMHDTYLK